MLLMQNLYYTANTALIYLGMSMARVIIGTYHTHVIVLTRFTHIMGVIALNTPSLGAYNAVCNDPFVRILKNGLTNIIGILTALGVAVAVIGIIIGGLMRATAWGSEQRIATSNKAIASAIVGLIIILLGVALGTAIPSWFGEQGNTCPLSPPAISAPESTAGPVPSSDPGTNSFSISRPVSQSHPESIFGRR